MANNKQLDWNDRYSSQEYVYGTSPNQFFKQEIDKLKPGNLLLIAEGEGRNAVYSAKNKWKVDAVDFSEQARFKALALAEKEKVVINYFLSDLNTYTPEKNKYNAAGIVYVHLPRVLKEGLFPKVIESLKSGGILILEVFSIKQQGSGVGGPRDPDLLYSKEEVSHFFFGLETLLLEEIIINLDEGDLHKGEKMVIRYVGKKRNVL